ncbi:McrB family protein [Paraclostridium bifermentans]|uniref:McrB family protein n=1 Tax=Paraclostridium bifermentans TaxID=1490 RepID=UPI0022E30018|nr:AAA family ATPase [Paraclostridium bifermentans]
MRLNRDKRKNLDIQKSEETYLLGVLAKNEESYPHLGITNSAVSVMRNNKDNDSRNIVFYIKAVSDEPQYIKDVINVSCNSGQLYAGIDGHHSTAYIEPFGYQNKNTYKLLSDEGKKEEIYKSLEDRLILFKPRIDADGIFKNVKIQSFTGEYKQGTEYMCVPVITNMDNKRFEESLINGEYIFLEDYNNNMNLPEFIICGDYIYSNFQSWEKHEGNYKLWRCDKGHEKIKKSYLNFNDEDYDYDVIDIIDNLIFVSYEYVESILYPLFDEGELIIKDYDTQTREEQDKYNTHTNEDEKNKSESKENIYDIKSKENEFLNQFKNYTIENNLCYEMKDLVNFHVSVKTNQLTIVAGMSGTGKTQVARAYASTLGINEDNGTLLFLPISPSYTEPEDLIGYLNNTTGIYIASETGLVDLLIHAEKNTEQMHMIIFDEMNLSQVEHWFAPFISLLELPERDRKLKLYSKNSVCHNNTRYSDAVNIGDNIIFIGTVNLDETTKDFSDRLLDRANIVTLNKKKFIDFKNEKMNKKYKSHEKINTIYSYQEYSSWIDSRNRVEDLTDEELIFLDDLHELIQSYDIQKGVSFRILEKICSYINNIPYAFDSMEILSRREAFDIEIKQRLLTKIKGSERQFGELIGKIDCENNIINSKIHDFFESDMAESISDFEITKQEILRKAKELTLYGYTN